MLFETPEDTYRAYQRFLKKEEYRKAYRCLEKMLHEFPDDIELLEDIVTLCLFKWNKPDIGRNWLINLVKIRHLWTDYAMLSHVEAGLGNFGHAREYLKTALGLQKKQPWVKSKKGAKRLFSELEGFIKLKEWNVMVEAESRNQIKNREKEPKERSAEKKTPEPIHLKVSTSESGDNRRQKPEGVPGPSLCNENTIQIPSYAISVKKDLFNEALFLPFLEQGVSPLKEIQMFMDYMYLTIQGGFDELLCLNVINGVEKYWYQIETVKKALRHFHGRVLLCDEVGLGKTIEAGMLIKEYLMRGMVKNVLILTPSPLVSQWKEEMGAKFGVEFETTDDPEFAREPATFWRRRFIIASIHTAKSSKHMPRVIEQFYDLVVVDEAHHLRNRSTLAWKLVNQIKKRFIFLLTATPVQNNLIELFNLITLINPGLFKTEKQFKAEYLKKGNLKATADKERLRGLLRDVMIRNTRSAIDLKLPKRFATTVRLEPSATEREIYARINEYLKRQDFKKPMITLFLREVRSSPFALRQSLLGLDHKDDVKEIIDAIHSLDEICKGKALVEILLKSPDEKKIIFTQFIKSMDHMTDLLSKHGIPCVTFRGDMPSREKDAAIARFKEEIPVLVSTESGGEGRNMQFCNTIINFDLPWNPMRIEQRVGRLHRIGQTRDVFIFNLSVKETIEDYVIEILDGKINMFEMVIGEIEPILGRLGEDRDFEDIIMEIWLKSGDKERLKDGFEHLGDELVKAKSEYLAAKALDNEILGEDYEI